jgi:hypothetical protein
MCTSRASVSTPRSVFRCSTIHCSSSANLFDSEWACALSEALYVTVLVASQRSVASGSTLDGGTEVAAGSVVNGNRSANSTMLSLPVVVQGAAVLQAGSSIAAGTKLEAGTHGLRTNEKTSI